MALHTPLGCLSPITKDNLPVSSTVVEHHIQLATERKVKRVKVKLHQKMEVLRRSLCKRMSECQTGTGYNRWHGQDKMAKEELWCMEQEICQCFLRQGLDFYIRHIISAFEDELEQAMLLKFIEIDLGTHTYS